MIAWFVSDIHITSPDDPRLGAFEEFLHARLGDNTTHVFLVGDIFDLWVGGDEFFARRYSRVVELVRELRTKNVDIIYFEGNHDLHLEKFWSEQLGCRVCVGPQYFDLGQFRVRVEHGDQMNPSDTGYLVLRRILRTNFVEGLADRLPGSFVQKLGNVMSRSSRRWTSSPVKARTEISIREMIRRHAERAYQADEPFDLIISGHVHVSDEYEWSTAAGAIVKSVNLGVWTRGQAPAAYCLTEAGGTWVSLS